MGGTKRKMLLSLSRRCWIDETAQIYARMHPAASVIRRHVYLQKRQGQTHSPNKHQDEGNQGKRGAVQPLISICQSSCAGPGHVLPANGCFINPFLTFTKQEGTSGH